MEHVSSTMGRDRSTPDFLVSIVLIDQIIELFHYSPEAIMSLDELIQAANQLDEADLDVLLQRVVVLRAHRKANTLAKEEAELLQKINQGIDPELRAQYQALRTKREAETLTNAEHEMLIQLSSQIEQFGAQRLEALANLAQLRQVPVTELMATLGIQPVTYV